MAGLPGWQEACRAIIPAGPVPLRWGHVDPELRKEIQNHLKVVIIDDTQKFPPALPDERSNLRLRIIKATDVLHQACKTLDIALVFLAQLTQGAGITRAGRDTIIHFGK